MNKIVFIAIVVVLGPYFSYLATYQEKANQQIVQIKRIYENPEVLLRNSSNTLAK